MYAKFNSKPFTQKGKKNKIEIIYKILFKNKFDQFFLISENWLYGKKEKLFQTNIKEFFLKKRKERI